MFKPRKSASSATKKAAQPVEPSVTKKAAPTKKTPPPEPKAEPVAERPTATKKAVAIPVPMPTPTVAAEPAPVRSEQSAPEPVAVKPATKSSTKKVAPKAKEESSAEPSPVAKAVPPPEKAAETPPAPVKTEKRSAPKMTTVVAQVDVGWGNSLFVRGSAPGLSWDKGQKMDWTDSGWTWNTTAAKIAFELKLSLNDQVWAAGENLTVAPGQTLVVRPTFG